MPAGERRFKRARRARGIPSPSQCESNTWCRDTLTRLAALGTLSRNAGEGLHEVQPQSPLLHCGRGGTQPVGLGG